MPGDVLQAIKNYMVGRLGYKATLSNSYMVGMFWGILHGGAQLELFAGFKSFLRSGV